MPLSNAMSEHPSFSFPLNSLEQTARLGGLLARTIQQVNPGALLLYGSLGAGKTTLSRYLVAQLPGGEYAEVASPSFTIANIYCTAPVVHHFDLYRLEYGGIDEALEESFDDPDVLTLVEWSERLAERDIPGDGLVCRIIRDESRAEALLCGLGGVGGNFMERFRSAYGESEL